MRFSVGKRVANIASALQGVVRSFGAAVARVARGFHWLFYENEDWWGYSGYSGSRGSYSGYSTSISLKDIRAAAAGITERLRRQTVSGLKIKWSEARKWQKAGLIGGYALGAAVMLQGAASMADTINPVTMPMAPQHSTEQLVQMLIHGPDMTAVTIPAKPDVQDENTPDDNKEDTASDPDNVSSPFAENVKWRMSSHFGLRRDPIVSSRYERHPGLDLAAPSGTPIHEVYGGKVVYSGWCNGYGNMVAVRTETPNGPINEVYGHMKKILVQTGDEVQSKDVIGLVGSTGYATGPHLHYEIDDALHPTLRHKLGNPVNPLNFRPVRVALNQDPALT